MTIEIRISENGQQDIKNIWRGLAEYRLEIADKQIKRIQQKISPLSKFPLAGRERSDISPNLRSVPVDRLVVFYHIDQKDDRTIVEIDRIIDGTRDLSSLFDDPESEEI
jgi:plasmid stabilization system protein ParE